MARATTKEQLMNNASEDFAKLCEIIGSMTDKELSTTFDFTKDEKKKEQHWNRDKNLRDIYVHLYEWHCLVINWVNSNISGEEKSFLPAPYNWRTYGDMNIEFWEKHQDTSLSKAKENFEESHKEILDLANKFTDEQLFSKNIYKWVGGSTLGSYFVSATASHYQWAIKKLKAHIKNCKA